MDQLVSANWYVAGTKDSQLGTTHRGTRDKAIEWGLGDLPGFPLRISWL